MTDCRLRVFAGPNGSGKSTLFDFFSKKYPTGYNLNADNIERQLATSGRLNLSDFGLQLKQEDLEEFLQKASIQSLLEKAKADNLNIAVRIKDNEIINPQKVTHSYEGALVSAFIRFHLMQNRTNFSFETVMSHLSKIDEIKEAHNKGYKTYLYFICTDSPVVNISRVENRVKSGGHDVKPAKIESRYCQTLENLIKVIECCDKCYFFDNSGKEFILLAKISEAREMHLEVDANKLPNWFINYVLKYYM